MIIFNHNVLAKPGPDLGARLPDPDGMRLWNMFHSQTLGRLALVVDEDVDRDIFEHWLKINNVKASIYDILDTDDVVIKAEKIHRISMTMGRSDWYIDNDPVTCAHTLSLGIPTLFVANPYIVRPEWAVETATPTAWSDLVAEVDRQAELRTARTWGDGPQHYDGD